MSDEAAAPPIGESDFSCSFSAGQTVFEEGQDGAEMYIIQTGEVEIFKESDGHRLALLEEGDFFGEMAILENLPRTAGARAVTDCALVRIDRGTFDQLVKNDPEIAIRMLRKLSYRLRQAGPTLIDSIAEAPVAITEAQGDSPLVPQGTSVGKPRLISAEPGYEVPLSDSGTTTIGRFDSSTGIHPNIDLKPLDHDRSTSRRHAVIETKQGSFFVRDEVGAANGTFVNGTRLAPGVEFEISHGDTLQFGLVAFEFRTD
jgi:pSer/pThr/pTyr-binding forkhead associated (FHA) protein